MRLVAGGHMALYSTSLMLLWYLTGWSEWDVVFRMCVMPLCLLTKHSPDPRCSELICSPGRTICLPFEQPKSRWRKKRRNSIQLGLSWLQHGWEHKLPETLIHYLLMPECCVRPCWLWCEAFKCSIMLINSHPTFWLAASYPQLQHVDSQSAQRRVVYTVFACFCCRPKVDASYFWHCYQQWYSG